MEQLRVIGTEDGALVLATTSGERFSLPVDDMLRAELRRTQRARESRGVRANPKEIQAQIRAGLTAAEVASVLGVPVEDVVRYERPVLAEREFIVGQALAVPVLLGGDLENDGSSTFGTAVRAKLEEAGATGERWTSWKEPTGWTVKLEFVAGDVERDARWSFDPRRSSLSPLNADATQLSRQGSLPEGLIPRLRALDSTGIKDDSRFDSGAFGPRHETPEPSAPAQPQGSAAAQPQSSAATQPQGSAAGQASMSSAAHDAAIKRAPDAHATSTETADLLEALRRRRGQREPLPEAADTESEQSTRASAPVALFDALEPGYDDADDDTAPSSAAATSEPSRAESRRKGRTSMPSWDEIVFGARTDD